VAAHNCLKLTYAQPEDLRRDLRRALSRGAPHQRQ
jgi:hypothetical protein